MITNSFYILTNTNFIFSTDFTWTTPEIYEIADYKP